MATTTTAERLPIDPYTAPVVDAESHGTESHSENITLLRNMKLGLFHVGSSLADILTTGVWNRIAIAELGLSATPVAILVSLKYFITPLSIWAGQRSDVTQWRGYRRLPFIWGGRLLMVLSFFLLGMATVNLASDKSSLFGWLGITAAFLIFSVGGALSGTTFLSLVHDITPQSQRTRVISVIWFFLIVGFAGAGILYSQLLPHYSEESFKALFIIAPLIMGAIWVFALIGEEKPNAAAVATKIEQAKARSFVEDLRTAWGNTQTRLFFLYLGLSTLFFYTQDVILEPFGAQVFGMEARTTNRFSSYWGSMALLGIIVCLLAGRRWKNLLNNMSLSKWSLWVLVIGFGIFLASALFLIRPLVTIGLVVMGFGLGMWTVGGLGLMMDMTRTLGAGLYLSLWTVSETIARGLGTVLGGVVKDATFAFTHQLNVAYGTVFLVQIVGFIISYLVITRVNVDLFHQSAAPEPQVVMSAGMD
ncbi:MAG: BCD family MFS transporter [Anaerolineae bacterium]